jgi:hypothetical protein
MGSNKKQEIVIGLIIFCVLLSSVFIYYFTKKSSDGVKYIELVKDNRDPSSGSYNAGGSQSFGIVELKAYDENDVLINIDRYKSVVWTPNTGLALKNPGMNALDGDLTTFAESDDDLQPRLLFTLKKVTVIKKVIVNNRQDYENVVDRIKGVKLNLYDTNKKLIKSCTLSGDETTTCGWV